MRKCREHGSVCEGAAPGRSVWCQGGAGHIVQYDDLVEVDGVTAPAAAPTREEIEMPRGVKGSGPVRPAKAPSKAGRTETIESMAFVDGAGAKMRVSLRRVGSIYQVFVLHLDGKSKRSGVLEGTNSETAGDAKPHYDKAIARTKAKGWQVSLGRRHREGLHDIPDPKPAPGVRRTA